MVNNLANKQLIPDFQPPEQTKPDINWCTITLSDVIKANKRLEASVFEVKGKHARELVLNSKWGAVKLDDPNNGLISNAYYPGRFKRIYSDSINGIPFYLPSQMTDIYPSPQKYIAALTNCDIDELKLKKGNLLLTRSGTVGNVTVVSNTLKNKVYSDDVIRVTLKKDIDVGFLYAFLRSATGNLVLQTNGYGSVITHIEPEHLSEIFVPTPPDTIKEKINDLITCSFDLRDESNELIDKATAIMIEELKLPPIHKFITEKFNAQNEIDNFSVKLSYINGRFDASYHVPIIKAIKGHLEKYANDVIMVGDKRISKEIILPGRFKRIYVEEGQGRVFFGGKQIFELDPSNKKYLSLVHHGERIKKQLELHENMTMITCSGTIGKVTLVPKHWENWTANQHIIRVVPASKDIAGYLSIFLASDYGYHLITRYTYGSVVDEIDDKHVSQIPLPLLKNKAVQDEINSLALQANQKRYEAYKLEQEAMEIMNDEVIFA